MKRRSYIAALAIALSGLGGCLPWPSHDPARLRRIRNEAQSLIRAYQIEPPADSAEVPASRLPPAIAGLRPQFVTVQPWGLAITVKPYFDGGWGYDIPSGGRGLPRPASCYSQPYPGVFWHGPC